MPAPVRVLTAVPICDGHDSAINTINLEFIRHGIEVVYLGYHRYAEDIVRAALQEDVRAVARWKFLRVMWSRADVRPECHCSTRDCR